MRKLGSDQRFYIESEDEENVAEKVDQTRYGDESDSSDSSPPDSPHRSRPNSYTTSWPQSYRCLCHSVQLRLARNSVLPSFGFAQTRDRCLKVQNLSTNHPSFIYHGSAEYPSAAFNDLLSVGRNQ